MKDNFIFDFAIIGAGVVGNAIARELSKYNLKIAVIEKNYDVCFETSGRNSGVIHAGFSYDTGSLKNKLCVQGNEEFDEVSKILDVPFKRCGKLLVGHTEEDFNQLKKIMQQGKNNQVQGMKLINETEINKLVPDAVGKYGIYSKNSGIVDPFIYTIALAESAAINSVNYFFDTKVINIKYLDSEQIYCIKTSKSTINSRWIINSAGLNCNEISNLVGINYNVIGSKGEYIVLNKKSGNKLPMPIYPVPNNTYMGIHVTNTTDGNVLVGPDAENVCCSSNYPTHKDNIDNLAKNANKIWPLVNRKDYIRTYSGILPKKTSSNGNIEDFTIKIEDDTTPNFINLIGIESPGLTAALPIGRYVVNLIKEKENLTSNKNFIPHRKGIRKFSEMSYAEQKIAISQNKDYGEIVCRCQKVSKAEIIQAINNPLNISTVSSIKYRTKSMMGQCQGGYCQMRITNLIEEIKNIPAENIKYQGENSNMFIGKIR